MGAHGGALCHDCGSSLAPGQRYCVSCGARVGSRSASSRRSWRAPRLPAALLAPGLRLPAPKVSAALVLLFTAFGVLLGTLAGSRTPDTLAASGGPLRVMLPAPSAGGSTSKQAEAEPPAAPEREAGEGEPATPEPTAKPTAAAPPGTSKTSGEGEGGGQAQAPSESSRSAGGAGGASKLPAIKHVFVIVLADEPYATAFGPASTAHYLAGTLERRGALLVRYDAIAHEELPNEIALLSGQGPTPQTEADCPTYADLAPAAGGADEQALGEGCVYPSTTQTLPGQLSARRLSWRAYVQGMDEGAAQPAACAHPANGQLDPTAAAEGGAYATFRNPFAYFHSLLDTSSCASGEAGLDRLSSDLASARRAPSFAYVVPDRCHDGSPSPCAPGAPAGMAPADALLRQIVPRIVRSPAYRDGGLLVITSDEAPSSGEYADSSSCCGQPSYPNLPPPSAAGPVGRGGGTVGALLLSPFIKGPETSQEPYDHFSLLRTIEDVFRLRHLGYAALAAVKPIEASLFSASATPARSR